MAVTHSILAALHHLPRGGDIDQDLGTIRFDKGDADATVRWTDGRVGAVGSRVIIEPTARARSRLGVLRLGALE